MSLVTTAMSWSPQLGTAHLDIFVDEALRTSYHFENQTVSLSATTTPATFTLAEFDAGLIQLEDWIKLCSRYLGLSSDHPLHLWRHEQEVNKVKDRVTIQGIIVLDNVYNRTTGLATIATRPAMTMTVQEFLVFLQVERAFHDISKTFT